MKLLSLKSSELTEEDKLIESAKKDPLIFGQLYDKYYRQIFGFIYKRTNNVELAKDLTSETFFQALKNLWRYRPQGKSFSSWLYRIAIAQIGSFYRQRQKYCELTLEQAPELIANPSYQPDVLYSQIEKEDELESLAQKVHTLLLQLKQAEHTIIVLKYYENKTIKEIAEIMGMRESTVKSHIHRGIKTMQKLLDNSLKPITYEQSIQADSKTQRGRALEQVEA